jgi:hypothetical protein
MSRLSEYQEAYTVGMASVIAEFNPCKSEKALRQYSVQELNSEALELLETVNYHSTVKRLFRLYVFMFDEQLKELYYITEDNSEITALIKEMTRIKDKIKD